MATSVDSGKAGGKHQGAEIENTEKEIIRQKQKLYELQRENKKLQASANRYYVYKDFLEKVEEKSGSTATVGGLIDRFEKLSQTCKDISKHIEQLNEAKERFTSEHAAEVNVCDLPVFSIHQPLPEFGRSDSSAEHADGAAAEPSEGHPHAGEEGRAEPVLP